MTDIEAVVQRYYGDRPVMQRIDDALRAAGVDPERPSHRDLWPFDQLKIGPLVQVYTADHPRAAASGLRERRARADRPKRLDRGRRDRLAGRQHRG